MRRLTAFLLWLYGQLLILYPASFRTLYQEEMEATFRRVLAEKGGRHPYSACVVFLREVRDLPGSLATVYRSQKQQGWAPQPTEGIDLAQPAALPRGWMGNQATVPPLSWKKVGLAILPGVYLLAVTMLDLTYLGIWPNIVFVAGCAMVVLMGVWQERTLPVWCYPLCGLMICVSWLVTAGLPWLLAVFAIAILLSWGYTFASLAAVWKQVSWVSWMLLGVILLTAIVTAALMLLPHRQWPGWLLWLLPFVGTPAMPFTSWLALALVPLARRQGLRTALLVLGVGFWMWMFSLDFNYSLAGSAWANLMNTIWTATVLVAAPLWVLRARTARQRQWGLILPMLLALVAIVPLEAVARHAPDLLAGYVDLFRFGPDTGAMVAGIGTRPRAELMAGLLRNLAQAGAVLLHWLIVVILFNSLERMPSDSGQLPLSNLRNRAVNAFVVR